MSEKKKVTKELVDDEIRILEARLSNGEENKQIYKKKLKNLKLIKEIVNNEVKRQWREKENRGI